MAKLTRHLTRARLAKVAPFLKGDVLDLGCGHAQILRDFGARISTYCGVERSREAVEQCKKEFPDALFLQRDLDQEALGLDKQFDCVLMIALIEHLFNQKYVMDQVKQALKPEGIVVITTPTPFGNDIVHRLGGALGLFAKSAVDDHIVIYNRHRFTILAKEIGLELTHYRTFQLFCNQLAILAKPEI